MACVPDDPCDVSEPVSNEMLVSPQPGRVVFEGVDREKLGPSSTYQTAGFCWFRFWVGLSEVVGSRFQPDVVSAAEETPETGSRRNQD